MGKPKAEKRNDKRQWKHKARERKRLRRRKHHGQRESKIYLDYACEGGIINVKEENCKTTIDKGKFCDVTCNRAKSGGRVVKRGKKYKVLVKDKLSPENTFGETASGETIHPKSEIRLLHASQDGEISMKGSTFDFTVETNAKANVILYDADNKGIINVDDSTHTSDVKLGPTANCTVTAVTAVGGKFSGDGTKFAAKVTPNSSTGNVAEGASSLAGIPSATGNTPAETSAPAQKISVPLRSFSKKLTKHEQFEPDAKVVDKRADIKKIFGEEGEIQLFYKVDKTEKEIDESITFRKINEIGATIVVKADVICTSGASVNKVPQMA